MLVTLDLFPERSMQSAELNIIRNDRRMGMWMKTASGWLAVDGSLAAVAMEVLAVLGLWRLDDQGCPTHCGSLWGFR